MREERQEIIDEFNEEVYATSERCAAEGYPSHGSSSDLRVGQLRKDYREWYPEIF